MIELVGLFILCIVSSLDGFCFESHHMQPTSEEPLHQNTALHILGIQKLLELSYGHSKQGCQNITSTSSPLP